MMKESRGFPRAASLLVVCFLIAASTLALAACSLLEMPPVSPDSSSLEAPAAPTDTPTSVEETPEPIAQATEVDTPTPVATDTPTPEPTETPLPPTSTPVPPTPAPTATSAPTSTPTPTPVPVGPIQSNPDNQFAVLLLGYGGPGHDGPYLTDSMMVVIANPAKKTLTLLSLPRDSWVPLSYTGGKPNTYDKLNTAYAYAHDTRLYTNRVARYKGSNGAGNMAKDTVSQILGIPIDHYLAIDFRAFKNVVDTLGGIDVDVPNSFVARYPANDNPDINAAWTTVRFVRGPQRMNGTRALQFARAREILDNPAEVGDFARATRQRLILSAVRARVLQPAGLLRLPQLLAIASRSSVTDYPLPAVANLLGMVVSWGDVKFYQAAISTSNYLQLGTGPGGAYILLPRADELSWSDVRAFSRRLWQDPTLGVSLSQTEVQVVNRSGDADLGRQVSDRLAALGYVVAPARSGPVRITTGVLDQSGGKAGTLVGMLGVDLGLPPLSVAPGARSDPGRIVLELGQDAVGVVRTDLPAAEDGVPTSAVGVRRVGAWVP